MIRHIILTGLIAATSGGIARADNTHGIVTALDAVGSKIGWGFVLKTPPDPCTPPDPQTPPRKVLRKVLD